jgi:hypothetical protein
MLSRGERLRQPYVQDALVERIAALFHDALVQTESSRRAGESATREKETRTPR